MMTKNRATVNWNLKGADSPLRADRPGQSVEGAVGAVVKQPLGTVFGERRQGADRGEEGVARGDGRESGAGPFAEIGHVGVAAEERVANDEPGAGPEDVGVAREDRAAEIVGKGKSGLVHLGADDHRHVTGDRFAHQLVELGDLDGLFLRLLDVPVAVGDEGDRGAPQAAEQVDPAGAVGLAAAGAVEPGGGGDGVAGADPGGEGLGRGKGVDPRLLVTDVTASTLSGIRP